ncbi:urease accessory protein UreF [Rhodobacteraceae bacterium RKSG542]|uniref:urease accessory protein UreF n=1 Tax=Pseudovibrio flavus TaxID=2529854 RepID=UPI0012BD63FC|nr:urease accessory protein UreF [Pseudovibrio flavus]MTI17944.1 urease accessory protein UreF [Pseudovibrio flavus]
MDTHTEAGKTEYGAVDLQGLLRLQTWLSPAFPIGAFSYSHGVETAIRHGLIHDRDSASDWLQVLLEHGSGWNDALIFCESWRAALAEDKARLVEANTLALAMAPSLERYQETVQQGDAFIDAAKAWSDNDNGLLGVLSPIAMPVAVGATSALHGISLSAALAAFLQAFLANLVSAMVRHVPLGQKEGVALLHTLEVPLLDITAKAEGCTLDDLGSAAILSDIASMAHEIQTTRIFRS